jgi:hypothetical protein
MSDLVIAGTYALMGLIGWFVRVLWEADKELRQDLARLREEIPKEYVNRDDYRSDIAEIKQMLRSIFERLDDKADK